MLLSSRVAIITGGARGIGRGIAITFAEEGCSVIIADILETEAKKTVEELLKKGIDAIFVPCDVTNSTQVETMVNKSISKFGKVDILVNNAGIGSSPKSITLVPKEEWDKVLAVNLTSMFLCCKAVVPHMKEKRYGKIINMASLGAINPFGPMVMYHASKAGIITFSVDLALELAPFNICVNAILPGLIQTAMSEQGVPPGVKKEDFFAGLGKVVPMQRIGTPKDVAKVALFFASSLSDYVTADRIIVSGGLPYRYMA